MTTVKELRKLAKGRNIKGYSKMRKADLLRVLNIEPPTKPPTVKDLRKIAKEKNIKGYYKMKKIELIEAIRNYDEILTRTDRSQTINEVFPIEDSFFEPKQNNEKVRPRFVEENFKSRHTQFEIQNEWGIQDLDEFLDIVRKPTFGLLRKWLRLHNGIRANFCVTATYEREGQREIIATEPMHLQTENYIFLPETNLTEMYDNITNDIIGRHDNISENLEGTQWVLVSIDSFRININKYDPLRANSFIELPKTLASKKAIINVKNEEDDKCYLWSILAGLFPVDKNPQRVTQYKKYEHIFDKALEKMEFPMEVQNNNTFVNRVNKLNLIEGGLSVNIYHYNKHYKIYPLSDITKDEKQNHVDLLYLKDDKGNSHYCLIKDLWKLVARQETKNCKKRYLCKMCLNSFPCEKVLSDHKNYCGLNKPAKVVLPNKADNIVEFKNYNHSMKVPFSIEVDFESLIRKLNKIKQLNNKIEELGKKLNKSKEEVEEFESYTIKLQRHLPISFVYHIKYANGEVKPRLFKYSPSENQSICSYFGLDAPKKLYEKLREDALFIAKEYLDKKIKMKELTERQKMEYKCAKNCHICERNLKDDPPIIEKSLRIFKRKIDIISNILLGKNKDLLKKFNEEKIKCDDKDINRFYEEYLIKLKNINLEDENENFLKKLNEEKSKSKINIKLEDKKEKFLKKLNEEKSKSKINKKGYLDTNKEIIDEFYKKYLIKIENEDQKFIEFVEENKRRDQLLAEYSDLIDEIKLEYTNKIDNKMKVHDHDHLTGDFRGAAHSICNINYKVPRFIPIYFHNFSGYDAHLLVKEFGDDYDDIKLIPNNEEKYISFSKVIKYDSGLKNTKGEIIYNNIELRFLDSYKLLPSSLNVLSKNMKRCHFKNLRKWFDKSAPKNLTEMERKYLFKLLSKKLAYPYDYMNSLEKYNEKQLPPKEKFYNILNDEHVNDGEYHYAQEIWKYFNIKNMKEFTMLYNTIDVLLLADIMENFRETSLKIYKLDPAWYYTTPGFAWDCMLKTTKQKLELLTDVDMLLMFERAKRGGISQCSNRYAKANNKYMEKKFNKNKDSVFIQYLDANNLYGWGMCKHLPYGGFEWRNPEYFNEERILKMKEKQKTGYLFEVDLKYPEELHDKHSDLPYCPENVIDDKQLPKLFTTLYDKKKYVLHYLNLKQALEAGLKLEKIHRVIKFDQSDWMKVYIEKNTKLRQEAKNDFEKDFFKLMNNSVFGRTMMNVRKHVDIKLISEGNKYTKYVSKPNFEKSTFFDKNLAAVHMRRTMIKFNQPIYVGVAILDISKTLMYDFYYRLKERYGDKIKLLYTDTDSLIISIKTKDFYEDMKDMIDEFDTSDYKKDNSYGLPQVNKKVLGKFKDEMNGKILEEFIGLASKLYSNKVFASNNDEMKKAKGVKKNIIKNQITHNDYKICLENKITKTVKQKMIRSTKHRIYTIEQNKRGLSSFDDKRCLFDRQTDTLPWGCLLYTSPSPRDRTRSRMPSSA